MEAIDNKYLIIVKGDGTIAAITFYEMYLKGKINVSEIIAKGWTTILNVEVNDDEHRLRNKKTNEKTSMLIFPSTFSSFEQASISLELFYYYSQDDRNCFNFYDVETGALKSSSKEEAREKLEEEKNRLEQIYEQEYISKKALRLIYPDGKIESVNETLNIELGDKYHLYYYTKLYNKSPKLRSLLTNFIPYSEERDDVGHNEIDNELVNKQVAILLNQYAGVELSERTHPLAEFRILLPKNYGSILQAEKTEEILKKYPEHRMSLGKWSDEMERCTSTYVTDVLSDIALKKELIRKEGK